MEEIRLSPLGHTWILDLDGTLIKHNGYSIDGRDALLSGAGEFLKGIDENDMIVFITSRTEALKEETERFLETQGIRYDGIIWGAPFGERILINDRKPSGLETAIAVNTDRDVFCDVLFTKDKSL